MSFDTTRFRPITPADDDAVARLIRAVMPEFGAGGAGFAISDPEVDHMCAAYSSPRSAYFVLELGGKVMGGAGFGPLAGGLADVCELRKMYFLPEARGRGLGQKLLTLCLTEAAKRGFRRCYIETLAGMKEATGLYEKNGFTRLEAPLGATGHFGCDRWYIKHLDEDSP